MVSPVLPSEPEGRSCPVRARRCRHCVDAQTANCARFVVPPAREVVDIPAHFVGPGCRTETARQIHERIGTLYVGFEVAASARIEDVAARIVKDRVEPTHPIMSQWRFQACRDISGPLRRPWQWRIAEVLLTGCHTDNV